MPVSVQHKAVFVHIPKTGGTSIEKALGIHRDWRLAHLDVLHGRFFIDGRRYLLQHMPLSQTLKFAALCNDVNGFFRFAFVRNPWDRLVSEYFWRKKNEEDQNFETFIDHVYDCVMDRIDLEGGNCHYRPQHEFLDGPLDFIGRFERFEADIGVVCRKIGLTLEKVPHEYQTTHMHYSCYYNERSKKKVYNAYGGDVAKFGYKFDG